VSARRGRKLALAAGGVVVALLLGELLLAIAGAFPPRPITQVGEHPDHDRRNFVSDPELGWRMRPGVSFVWKTEGVPFPIAAGPDGFRVDGESGEAAADPAPLRRIAFLGDSFTFGTGVRYAETFAARTAARLGAREQNVGMPGYGVDQMWCALEKVVLPDAPDLAVVALVFHDFERSLHAWREAEGFNKPVFKVSGGALARKTAQDRPPAWLRFLETRSRLFTAGRALERRLGEQWGAGEWWALNAACLDSMAAAAARAQVPLLVVLIPSGEQPRPFPALERHLVERGVPYADLLADWKGRPPDCYWPQDGHLNAAGHERVSQSLAPLLARLWPDRFSLAR
jgi:hypothetical protein